MVSFDQQNRAMIAQNDSIKKQIDQVELQQCAWLAASPNPLNQSPDNTTLDWQIIVRNIGQTPAIIKYSEVEFVPHNKRFYANGDNRFEPIKWRDHINQKARATPPRHTTIAPGDTMAFGFQDINQAVCVPNLTPEQYQQSVAFGRMIGLFIYDDVWGKEHVMFCCYRNNPAFKALTNHNEYSEST